MTLIALALTPKPKPHIPEFRPLLKEQREVAKRIWLQYRDEAIARIPKRSRIEEAAGQIRVGIKT